MKRESEHIPAKFHQKSNHKKKPTDKHKQDKLNALKKELQFWTRHEGSKSFIGTIANKRITQIMNRILMLETTFKKEQK